jgi:hypothetical protein
MHTTVNLAGSDVQCFLDTQNGRIKFADVCAANGAYAFPAYERTFTQELRHAMCIYDAKYIERAAKAFKTLTEGYEPEGGKVKRVAAYLTMKVSDTYGPLVVTSVQVPELLVLVMPIRQSEPRSYNEHAPNLLVRDYRRLPGDVSTPA